MGPGGRLSAKKGDMAAKLGLWLREGGQASRAPPVPPRRLPVLSPLCWARPPEALPFRGRPGTRSPITDEGTRTQPMAGVGTPDVIKTVN